MNSNAIFFIEGKEFQAQLNADKNNQFTILSVPKPYQVTWDESSNPFDKINDLLAHNCHNVLLIDENILELYAQYLSIPEDRIFVAKATETFKTLDGVKAVLDFLCERPFTKTETLVVVGGGIIQDVGAFVGACYKRGIHWVYFPTTLLSMCDSCIGGKTGINYRQAKNQIALFSAPTEVVINPYFLKTLPTDAIQSGLGEILKLFITGGDVFLSLYKKHVNFGRVEHWDSYKVLILSALAIKRSIVEEDEFEIHHRKSLNYGHTIGHAIETLANYKIPHGIAVVLGMILVNELSYQQGLLSKNEKFELDHLCEELLDKKTLSAVAELDTQALFDLLQKDKKTEGSQVGFVMLKTVGDICFVKIPLNSQLIDHINSGLDKVALY